MDVDGASSTLLINKTNTQNCLIFSLCNLKVVLFVLVKGRDCEEIRLHTFHPRVTLKKEMSKVTNTLSLKIT